MKKIAFHIITRKRRLNRRARFFMKEYLWNSQKAVAKKCDQSTERDILTQEMSKCRFWKNPRYGLLKF